MTTLEFLIIAILVFASAYISASEIALFSLSRFQIRHFRERSRKNFRQIKKLLADPGGLLITILVVNEILNIAISTLITRAVTISVPAEETRYLHLPLWAAHALIGTLISTPILLFLCEATPKSIAARANQLVASLTVNTINVIYNLFKPVRTVLKHVVSTVAIWSGKSEKLAEGNELLKESDFILMVEEGQKDGTVHASEVELIKNVFELDDTTVSSVLTPLPQVRSLPMTTTIREALISIKTQPFSRIPVTGSHRSDIVGILYSKDLLQAKLQIDQLPLPISEIMLKPVFVSPTLKLNSLFRTFKQRKTHMAIVQKTTGHALGIITMSDVMDTLFDDLFPEEEDE
jgi:CBS domain containing-hemolysin-like protein